MAAIFALLCDVEGGQRRPMWLLLIPPFMALWTNVHGGALGGLATILIVIIAWLVKRSGHDSIGPRNFMPISPVLLGVVGSLSILAIIANPYGPRLPAVWLGLMASDVLPKLIVEHAPMQIWSVEAAMILTLGAIYIYFLVVSWPGCRHITWLI